MALAPHLAHAQDAESAPLSGAWTVVQPSAEPAAGPLFTPLTPGDPVLKLDDRDRALDCLSLAIAYESAGQPVAGQEAVGQVILNRMRDPRFPKTVCGVVFQGSSRVTGCQFTFVCDGSYSRRRLSETTLAIARNVAGSVLDGTAPNRVGSATHYHADYVLPYWASSGQQVAKIGAHIFYRMGGDPSRWTKTAALTEPEPDAAAVPAMQRFVANRQMSGRRGHRPAAPIRLTQSAAASPHAMFAPWGLPVAPDPSN